MNVVVIQVMLHHFYCPVPYPGSSPAIRDAHMRCINEGLLEPTPETMESKSSDDIVRMLVTGSKEVDLRTATFRVTERGRVYVNGLMAVPTPVQAWVMPKPDERK